MNSFQDSFLSSWIHLRTREFISGLISEPINSSQNTFQSPISSFQSPQIHFRAQEFISEPSGHVFFFTLSAQSALSRALSVLNPGKSFQTVFAGYKSPSFLPFFPREFWLRGFFSLPTNPQPQTVALGAIAADWGCLWGSLILLKP